MKEIAARLAGVTSGMPAEQVALVVTLGFVLGTFPAPCCPTIFCVLASLALRQNPAPLQVVNQITTPLQYALIVPVNKIGARLLVSVSGPGAALTHAAVGWFLLCVPVGIALYFALVCILRRNRVELAA